MTEASPLALRQLLVTGYDDLKAMLTRRLGSAELAADRVQDTWLRLQRFKSPGRIENPARYLLRIALNVAHDRLASERRHAAEQLANAIDMPENMVHPERAIEARSELQLVQTLIREY